MSKHFSLFPDRRRVPPVACRMRALGRMVAGVVAGFLIAALMWLGTAPAHAASPSSPGSLAQIFKRVDPAVVVIRTSEHVAAVRPGAPSRDMMSVAGIGSGVLVSADGKVVTAAHVVQTVDSVDVEFIGGTVIKARVVASDAAADVALLQLEQVPPNVAPARFGDSDKTEVGDQVFIVGAPPIQGDVRGAGQHRTVPDRCGHQSRQFGRPDVRPER